MTKARTNADNIAGDISGVTAGTGITGGGTSGTVTVTNEMATTITAKGDLLAGTGNAAFDNLAAGSDGDTLLADSSQSTGLRYNPQNALANPVINGGYDIWQRGTSFANPANGYTADRWLGASNAGLTVSRQTVSDTTNLPNILYAIRIQRNSGSTTTSELAISQSFESVNTYPFVGKTVTLSFYARAGANFSSASSNMSARINTGTATDQNIWTAGYTGSAQPVAGTSTLTTTWQRFAYTGTIASTATEMGIIFGMTPVGTAGAADYFEVTGVQIDLGTYTASTAPTFRRSGGTLQGELAAAKRYFEIIKPPASASLFLAQCTHGGGGLGVFAYEVEKRVAPTITFSTAGDFDVFDNDGDRLALTAVSAEAIGTRTFRTSFSVASGLSAGNVTIISSDSGGNASIQFSAEL